MVAMDDAEQLRMEFASPSLLREEFSKNLSTGGCFVAGVSGLSQTQLCCLALVHPESGAQLELMARVVWVTGDGVGLAFEKFGPVLRERIRDFVEAPAAAEPVAEPAPPKPASTEPASTEPASTEPASTEPAPADKQPQDPAPRSGRSVHERMRGLSATEQLRVAREGEPSERTVLERIYGKAVWPALLSNPRLTVPEVARLARMGNMPRPQLEMIAGNASWLSSAQVRRALLCNPRTTSDMVRKILKLTPKSELKVMPKQTAYPQSVRAQAKKLLTTGR